MGNDRAREPGVRLAVEPLEDRATPSANGLPVTANELWADAAYRALLGRGAEAAALDTIGAGLDAGLFTHEQIAGAVLGSPEGLAAQVQAVFRGFLGRPADPAAVGLGVQFFQAGGTFDQFKAVVLGSDDYFVNRGGGTASGFAAALYRDLLARDATPADVAHVRLLLAVGATRADVALAVLGSEEADKQQVRYVYGQALDRASDPQGFPGWWIALQRGVPDQTVLAGFVGSREFVGLAAAGAKKPGITDGTSNTIVDGTSNTIVDGTSNTFVSGVVPSPGAGIIAVLIG